MIDRATADKIKEVADIVEVVSDYVKLTRRGVNYVGLCPFHNERTPSFSVNKSRNFCYCFSCHKGGSPVNFIMEKEGIGYQDALRQLASKYGIKITEREETDEERRAQSERESMMVANQWAMDLMHNQLSETDEGRDVGLKYLFGRQITMEAIKAFHIGYALDKGHALCDKAKSDGYNLEILKTLGLIGTAQDGRIYDRFRGRVIFPILNSAGKVLAFGGRDLKGGIAKYINSPESPVYKKSKELYGLYQAKTAIVKHNRCFLVEGYMDVISMWQSGIENVVASSGTALTDGQIALIHRFTDNVTLIYDGDSAGIKASIRGIDMLLSHNLNIKVLLLPDGDDPDSFARKNRPEEFIKYINEHEQDFIEFKTKVMLSDAGDDITKRSEAIKSIIGSLAVIPDKTKLSLYLQQCARSLKISEELLAAETSRLREMRVGSMKRERERKETDNTANKSPNTAIREKGTSDYKILTDGQLDALERKVLEFCVKYGMRECADMVSDDTDEPITIVELVKSELELDSIKFTNSLYSRIFGILLNMIPEFRKDSIQKISDINSEIEQLRNSGFEEISQKNLDMDGIKHEENLLENKLQTIITEKYQDFCNDYASKILASHEDNDVRETAIDLITVKYHLSKYYNKYGHVETEEDRLEDNVLRALNEWKQGILQSELTTLHSRLADADKAGDSATVKELQTKIFEILRLRAQFASSNGERVVIPKFK